MAASVLGGGGAAIAVFLVGLLRLGIGMGTVTSFVLGVSAAVLLSGITFGLHVTLGVDLLWAFVVVAGGVFATTWMHEVLP